jgi:hypothetical protein
VPPLHHRITLLIIVITVSAFVGCANDQEKIENLVDDFFVAVRSNRLDELENYFPGFAALGSAERQAYMSIFSSFTGWNVERIQVKGKNAVASIRALSGGGEMPIHLPLVYRDNRWIITERTSMRLDLGTVPAN